MSEPNIEVAKRGKRRWVVLVRLFAILSVAWLLGWLLHRSAGDLFPPGERAGLGRGILHGALMPLAMPNLIVGNDVTIYAPLNTGRGYKLGYTVGVNGCGLVFFYYFSWRIRHWRRSLAAI